MHTLAKLVEKIYGSGLKSVVVFKDRALLEEFNKVLWTYSSNSFIPHGADEPDFQAVWLTDCAENKNNARVAILINDCTLENIEKFEGMDKLLFFFTKHQEKMALAVYEELKKNKKSVNYWNQSTAGWTNNFN